MNRLTIFSVLAVAVIACNKVERTEKQPAPLEVKSEGNFVTVAECTVGKVTKKGVKLSRLPRHETMEKCNQALKMTSVAQSASIRFECRRAVGDMKNTAQFTLSCVESR